MKLVSMHINNYGKLSDLDYDFKGGINAFCENNGYGKSTIVSFLKAMFYGLSTYTKSTVAFVDRKHFYPFSKGNFGGNVVFEFSGKQYRIERSFAEKSLKDDKLTVYCDSNLTDELGDVPGLTVFGMNSDSFERLLCIDEEKISIASTGDMNKKLNNFALNTSDDFDIDAVLEKLAKSDKSSKKAIDKYKDTIKNLNNDIHNLEQMKKALDDKYILLNSAQAKADEAKKIHSEASAKAVVIEQWKHYDEKIAESAAFTENAKQILARYKMGLPDKNKAADIQSAITRINSNTDKLTASKVGEAVTGEMELLSKAYPNGFANEQQCKTADGLITELEDARRDYKTLSEKKQDGDLQRLEHHFGGQIPTAEKIAEIENDKRRCDALSQKLLNINKTIVETNRAVVDVKVPNKAVCGLIGIATAAALIVGVIMLFKSAAVGAVLLGFFVALAIACVVVYKCFPKTVKQTVENEPAERANPEYEQAKSELDSITAKMQTDLAYYRYVGKEPSELLFELKSDVQRYSSLISKNKETETQLSELQKKGEAVKSQLNELFAAFGIETTDYRSALKKMNEDKVRFDGLKKQTDDSRSVCEQLEKAIASDKQKAAAFFTEYELTEQTDIDAVIKDIEEIERINKQLDKVNKDAEKFKTENSLAFRPESADYDIDALQKAMNNSIGEVQRLEMEVDDLERDVSILDDKKEELAALIEQRDSAAKRKELLLKVSYELSGAERSLKDKLVKPMRDKFCKYALMIEQTLGQKVSMDKDYRISYDIDGALRSYEHLSDGNMSLCALCFRLAMIDSMFEGEQPFIIMDDPFVYLDSEHFYKTKELMKKLSDDKQIIYFCCHESRNLT